MSKGKQGIFTVVAALAMMATLAVAPAFAVTTSASVAATDELAPDPVSNVEAVQGTDGIVVTWDLSPSDFVHQSPTGSDFTSGGTFVNVNDVAAYEVWRSDGGLAAESLGSVQPGVTTFVDALPIGSSLIYSVTAVDGAGNPSAPAASPVPISPGAQPIASIDIGADPIGSVTVIDFGSDPQIGTTVNVQNTATDVDAILSVTISVEGPGFVTSVEALTLGAGEDGIFELSFVAADAGNLNGAYEGTLTIRTNDPDSREFVVPLLASITQGLITADIAVAPRVITYNQRLIGAVPVERTFTVSNNGGLPLTGSVALTGDAAFALSAGGGNFFLQGDGTFSGRVSFTPLAVQEYTGTITVTSDDADEPSIVIDITGAGVSVIKSPAAVTSSKFVVRLPFVTGTLIIPGLDPIDVADVAAVAAFLQNPTAQSAASATALTAVATSMGIDPSRIRNARWIAGSLIFVYDVAPAVEGSGDPTPEEALATMEVALADTATSNPITDIGTPDATAVTSETVVEVLFPLDDEDNIIVGWFTHGGTAVGFDDFFVFADNFGRVDTDPEFSPLYDIAPEGAANGAVDFDDFFRFADDFGKTVVNATEIQAALQ